MPCDSSHCEADEREVESRAVLELLREINGKPFNHEDPKTDYYGRVETLDADTARLCEWCRAHNVCAKSLELQLWWKRHQQHDKARIARELKAAKRSTAKRAALAKLTPYERLLISDDSVDD